MHRVSQHQQHSQFPSICYDPLHHLTLIPRLACPYPQPPRSSSFSDPLNHGRRNRGVWGVNVPPHFWDQGGTGGYRGSNENDLCFYSRQSLFSTVQVTEFQRSRHLPKVNDICKDGLVVFPRSTPTGLLRQWRSQGGTLVHAPRRQKG